MNEQRRKFLKQLGLLGATVAIGPVLPACEALFSSKQTLLPGTVHGANAALGHRLRDGKLPTPPAGRQESTDVLIIGGGVSGLSAARALQRAGKAYRLLELDRQIGGNAVGGRNEVSAYPWGAHYLPVPDGQIPELMGFLEEVGVIEGHDAQQRPLFKEEYLCHAPNERVYHNGRWFEGLVPNLHLKPADHADFQRFNALAEQLRQATGHDGKPFFAIPVDASSHDPEARALDKISMADWLAHQGLTSSFLYSYIDYYCRDDYGTSCQQTSAWAGLHYWAGRRANPGNADARAVLTWPEGNHWLVKQLAGQLEASRLQTGQVVYKLQSADDGIEAWVYDVAKAQAYTFRAKQAILALPTFVAQHLLPERPMPASFTYAPWVVANITVKPFPSGIGAPLCWDNIIYNSPSLGYVNANHQHLDPAPEKRVLTYYYALSEWEPAKARKWALSRSHAEWVSFVLQEMNQIHPQFDTYVEQLDVWVWGHGMIRPTIGFVWGEERQQAQKPWQGRIHFAHSDLSGCSIFEEAFSQGLKAAQAVCDALVA